MIVTLAVIRGIEPEERADNNAIPNQPAAEKGAFAAALTEVWRDNQARIFTIFVFVSMLAYWLRI